MLVVVVQMKDDGLRRTQARKHPRIAFSEYHHRQLFLTDDTFVPWSSRGWQALELDYDSAITFCGEVPGGSSQTTTGVHTH
jgi:hypothetical protein